MNDFSITTFFDAVVHVEIYLLVVISLYFLLRRLTRDEFDVSFIRVSAVVAVIFLMRVILSQHAWFSSWMVSVPILIAIGFFGAMSLIETGAKQSGIASVIAVLLCYAGGMGASAVFSALFPDEVSFARYVGLEKNRVEQGSAPGTEERAVKDIQAAPQRDPVLLLSQQNFFDLDSLEPGGLPRFLQLRRGHLNTLQQDELRELREQMAIALAQSGAATNRRLLMSLRDAGTEDIILFACALSGISVGNSNQVNHLILTLPQVLDRLGREVEKFTLSKEEEALLYHVAEQIYLEGFETGMVETQLHLLEEETADYAQTLLFALMQVKYDIPFDLLLNDSLTLSLLNVSSLKGLAVEYWNRNGMDADAEWAQAVSPRVPEEEEE